MDRCSSLLEGWPHRHNGRVQEVLAIGLRINGFLHVCNVIRHGRDGSSEVHNRSEEHTSELQSRGHLVCRLLLEKKKKKRIKYRMRRKIEVRHTMQNRIKQKKKENDK